MVPMEPIGSSAERTCRASVTEVLRPLQIDGLIRASRGKVVILDAKRLADASCECYGVIRGEYQRLLTFRN